MIEHLRRTHKWSARLITAELADRGITISQSTVTRWLARLGLEDRIDQLGPTRPGVEVSHGGLVDRAGEVVI